VDFLKTKANALLNGIFSLLNFIEKENIGKK
jgi:hypothetical protein